MLVSIILLERGAVGWEIVALSKEVQPLKSVTVTEYEPATKLEIS